MAQENPEHRASDADRERVATTLHQAHTEGRLALDEFDERVAAAYQARTYADLERLVTDLPRRDAAVAGVESAPVTTAMPTSARMVAVLSQASRKGAWRVPPRFSVTAFWGGGQVDLREALFEHQEVVLHCVAIMGGIQVIVPPEVDLEVRGTGVMGGFGRTAHETGVAGRRRVIVTGFALWGGVEVRRKAPKKPKRTDSPVS